MFLHEHARMHARTDGRTIRKHNASSLCIECNWPNGTKQYEVNSSLQSFTACYSITRKTVVSEGGGNVTSAGWQVTLRDTIWHVSSCSGVAG